MSIVKTFLSVVLMLTGTTGDPASKKTISDGCVIVNNAFKSGEYIGFNIYYTWGGLVNIKAGSGSFTTTATSLNGRNVYRVTGLGKTLKSYERFYKANDLYETYMDAVTLQPVKFVRNIHEGDYKKYENIVFNKSANTAITDKGVYKVPECVHDVVSGFFYARNIEYDKLKPNALVKYSMFLDGEVHPMYIRYVGKETIKTRVGTFRAIKIRPVTVKGNDFNGGEQMAVWLSDDDNRAYLKVESPIRVGKVKIEMTVFKNLRYPLSAKIKGE